MTTNIEIQHKGITVKIRKRIATRSGAEYTDYVINDYSSGTRVRHARASLEQAKDKAKEICERLARGKREAFHWPDRVIADVRRSMELIHPHGLSILGAAMIVNEAVKLVPTDEILAACRHWRENGPGKRFSPKQAKEAVDELLAKQSKRISARRHRTNKSYLTTFSEKFGQRFLNEIETRELKDWASEQKWCLRTRNDALGVVSLLYQDAIERKFVVVNPVKFRREKLPAADIQIYGPKEAITMLTAVGDDLKPFLATILFSGLRKEEASRMSALDVESALSSGVFFLHGSKAKTKISRSITVLPNLRKWLERYHRPGTPLLPERYQSMQALDDLHKLIERRSGVP